VEQGLVIVPVEKLPSTPAQAAAAAFAEGLSFQRRQALNKGKEPAQT
jgi:hypothetical protein